MAQQKLISVLILGLALALTVNTFTTNEGQEFCPADGNLNLAITQPEMEDYDHIGIMYDNLTKDSREVYIKDGDGVSENIKVKIYDEITGEPTIVEVADSSSWKFIKFLNGALIMSNSAGDTYYCGIFDLLYLSTTGYYIQSSEL